MKHVVVRSDSEQPIRGTPPRHSWRLGWIFPAIALGLLTAGVAIYVAEQPYFDWDLAISHSVQGVSSVRAREPAPRRLPGG